MPASEDRYGANHGVHAGGGTCEMGDPVARDHARRGAELGPFNYYALIAISQPDGGGGTATAVMADRGDESR